MPALVQSVIHDSRMHVFVQSPACETVERCPEVFECVVADPEATAIVAKEVVNYGHCLFDWHCPRCFLTCGAAFGQEFFRMEIDPRVPRTAETLYLDAGVVLRNVL